MFKLYNGCPNDELQDYLDSITEAKKFIKDNGYLITWFPLEQKYYMCEKETYKGFNIAFNSVTEAMNWLKKILNKVDMETFSNKGET